MNNDKNEIKIEGTLKESFLVPVNENVILHIIRFLPEKPEVNIPVIMVTGLATLIDSFYEMLSFLARHIPIIYVETREKRSSRINAKVSFGIEAQGHDLAVIMEYFELKEKEYFMLGYSYGATIIAAAYKYCGHKPEGIIFLEPTPVFHYPKWSLLLIRSFGSRLYSILKPIGKWYLRNFYINKKEDEEMAAISSKSLDNADPHKLRNAILDIAGYEVWNNLNFIDCRTLVVGTSKDGLHIKYEVERMTKMLKNAKYLDLETNLRTHSREMGKIAFSFFQNSLSDNLNL